MSSSDSGLGNYRDAYQRLSDIVQELESGEADLDRVLPLLEEAQRAYAVCQARIAAVRGVLASSTQSGEDLPQEP
ncbi:exodeoxyribonuclease VII small subunit [Deinococcus lacus]|uniref:Exodeoxyribonuclease VII small subunit n=1 Tax=Deinococcus lacus TaxID=392561 RepID=A0ABW1YEM9_9DEIO